MSVFLQLRLSYNGSTFNEAGEVVCDGDAAGGQTLPGWPVAHGLKFTIQWYLGKAFREPPMPNSTSAPFAYSASWPGWEKNYFCPLANQFILNSHRISSDRDIRSCSREVQFKHVGMTKAWVGTWTCEPRGGRVQTSFLRRDDLKSKKSLSSNSVTEIGLEHHPSGLDETYYTCLIRCRRVRIKHRCLGNARTTRPTPS